MLGLIASAQLITACLVGMEPQGTFPPQGEIVTRNYFFVSKMRFNEAIVSWNVSHPQSAALKVRARAIVDYRQTGWYTLGDWAGDSRLHPRQSVKGQSDPDGEVRTDTLHLNQFSKELEVSVEMSTLATGPLPELKLMTAAFSDTTKNPPDPNRRSKAWGKTIAVPELAQDEYPNGGVLCSPTSLAMVLGHYAQALHRPDLNSEVPQVSDAVWDAVYKGAGNWPFNTAYAGGFDGMVSYVARLDGIHDLESWTEDGFPVICSVSYDLLRGKALSPTEQGHLVVLVGFTQDGDPIFNDPARRGAVRQTYKRSDFERAWNYSHRTVYLIYPAGAEIPDTPYRLWVRQIP